MELNINKVKNKILEFYIHRDQVLSEVKSILYPLTL